MSQRWEDFQERIRYVADPQKIARVSRFHHTTLNCLLGLIVLKKISETDSDGFVDWHDIETATSGIGDLLNTTVHRIEKNHPALKGWFDGLDFNKALVRDDAQRDGVWKEVIAQFSGIELTYHDPKESWDLDDVCLLIYDHWFRYVTPDYEYAETPANVIQLETELISPPDGSSVYDPFCTSGTSLVVAAQTVRKTGLSKKIRLFGETGTKHHGLTTRLNLLLTDHPDGSVAVSDIIRNPGFIEGPRKLVTFHRIIGTLPPNTENWGEDAARGDPFSRFVYGIPPVTQGDFAYLQHGIASLTDDGMMAIAVPPSVLFKERSEGKIRMDIIKDDLVEAVILLPKKVYDYHNFNYGILVINRNKISDRKNKILFIDSSSDFWHGSRFQNILYPEYLDKIVTAYRALIDVEGYCRVCSIEEVEKNRFQLDVGRYVKQKRTMLPKVDLRASLKEIDTVHRMQVKEYEKVRVKADEIVEYLGRNGSGALMEDVR